MRRREFITLLGGAAALPLATQAQQTEKKRIGVLMSFAETDVSARVMLEGYRNALAPLGWIEGRNLHTEVRWAAGNPDKIRGFTNDLIEFSARRYSCSGDGFDELGHSRDAKHSDRLRQRGRPNWKRLGHEHRAPRRLRHRIHDRPFRAGRQMGDVVEGNRTGH